jgi:two-component system alkaline phosphatase synthesis response regulator PhoP
VLVVDDDHDILELLKYNLEKENFQVKSIEDSAKAIDAVVDFNPELIILDIMMPHVNGIELCRLIRQLPGFKDTYIFFLTARSEFYDQQAAIETGGDDFIEKVVGLRALTNKVISVLKRNFVIRKRDLVIHAGKLYLNRRSGIAKIGTEEIKLSPPEVDLLFFFVQNPGKIITAENLLGNIWGSEIYSVAKSIEVYIENLSKKLGKNWIVPLGEGRYRLRKH